MTTENMNVHKALVELKLLDKRIGIAIEVGSFVVGNKHSNTKINGVPVAEYADDIKTRYQQAMDLIRRREAIKRAVVKSNAITEVRIGEKTYTVAEAIDMKNTGVEHLRALQTKLAGDYNLATRMADRSNGDELERRADDYIRSLVGNTDTKGMTEELARMRSDFIASQTVELVDPIKVRDKLRDLEDEITAFTANVDAALSTSNALTMLEITY